MTRSPASIGAGTRPKVLLVDDHRRVLDAISALLARDFDVVGAATGGEQAVELVRRVTPDVVVLDVDMPGLDGFQTVRALAQSGVPAPPVVFLSMHDADDIVSAAFRCGGRGYVLKSHAASDLASAIEQALRGRLFVPSLTSLVRLPNGGGHAMHRYAALEPLLDALAAFFGQALSRGDAACVIATEPIRDGLGERLRTRGWNVGGATGHTRYRAIDAADALNQFMRKGLPDADRLAEVAAELNDYRRAVTEGASARLAIFGNMAAVLCAEGLDSAAVALEGIWSRLTHDLPFLTLCGYETSCFHEGLPALWPGVCDEHSVLSHAGDL